MHWSGCPTGQSPNFSICTIVLRSAPMCGTVLYNLFIHFLACFLASLFICGHWIIFSIENLSRLLQCNESEWAQHNVGHSWRTVRFIFQPILPITNKIDAKLNWIIIFYRPTGITGFSGKCPTFSWTVGPWRMTCRCGLARTVRHHQFESNFNKSKEDDLIVSSEHC